MPFIAPVIGAVIGAVGSVVGAVGAAVTAVGSVFGIAGAGAGIAGFAGSVSGFGALVGMGAALSPLGIVAAVGIAGGAIAAVAGIAGLLTPQHPGNGNINTTSPIAFKADINAGIPYVIGRTGVGGNVVFVDTSNEGHNKYLHYIAVLSHGPVTAIEKFYANNVPVSFNSVDPYQAFIVGVNWQGAWSGAASYQIDDGVLFAGTDYIAVAPSVNIAPPNASYWAPTTINNSQAWLNKMWQVNSLGPQPSTALPAPSAAGSVPEWDASCKLSGLAASRWCLVADATAYGAGTPKPTWVVWGPAVYDPRLDSTYPGGSGPQRWNDETTWAYSQNPFLHGLAWIIGRKNNGVRVLGLGIPITAIDVPAFVTGANVCDANGWKAGGQVFSTDSKWDVLSALLQAGGGTPMRLAARISCLVETPLVSIATLTGGDAIGPASIQGTTARKDRINRVIPNYRSETHEWSMVPAAAVEVTAYQTGDGGKRTKSYDYPLVQNVNQAAQLARYAIEDSREFGPITIPMRPQWMGVQPGDGVTLNEPEWGLTNQLCLVVDRQIDPTLGAPSFTFRSETTGKHAFALGQTGTPPPQPKLTGVDLTIVPAPVFGSWGAFGSTLNQGGQQVPVIYVGGAIDDPNAEQIVVEYSISGAGVWSHIIAGRTATLILITDVAPSTTYDVRVSYIRRGAQGPTTPTNPSPVTTGAVVSLAIVGQGALATLSSVATGNINPNAVSQFISAFNAGPVAVAGGLNVVATTINCTGGPITLTAVAIFSGGPNSYETANMLIYRDGTLIYNQFVAETVQLAGIVVFRHPCVNISWPDNPGAGVHTYTMAIQCTQCNVTSNFIQALELKR